MTKILITGAQGFLGNALYEHLKEQGYNVVGTYHKKKPANPDPNMYYCDLANFYQDDLKLFFDKINPDVVVHLSAISSPNSAKSPDEFMKINVGATERICRLLSEKKIIFASSVVTYGDNRSTSYEDTTLRKPTTLYGATKSASEDIITAYSKLNDLEYTILRFSAIVGENLTHGAIKDIKEKVKQDECILFGNSPGAIKPYLHVMDAVRFIEKIIPRKYSGKVYNVCPDDCASILEIKRLLDPENKCKETFDPSKTWRGDNRYICCDNSKMRSLYKMYYPTSASVIRSLLEEEENAL